MGAVSSSPALLRWHGCGALVRWEDRNDVAAWVVVVLQCGAWDAGLLSVCSGPPVAVMTCARMAPRFQSSAVGGSEAVQEWRCEQITEPSSAPRRGEESGLVGTILKDAVAGRRWHPNGVGGAGGGAECCSVVHPGPKFMGNFFEICC